MESKSNQSDDSYDYELELENKANNPPLTCR